MTTMTTQTLALNKISDAHPDLKGSFTCLGNWYNLHSDESMKKLDQMLANLTSMQDKGTAFHEIQYARSLSLIWTRDPSLTFLYEAANQLGKGNVKF